ncbi:MAG: hypothetical protein SGJ19_02130 [Planctomycetia bacterium]|nr:hypothetical protein [Planctomycetia bacterium]
MSDRYQLTADDRALFARIAKLVRAHSDVFEDAGKWVDAFSQSVPVEDVFASAFMTLLLDEQTLADRAANDFRVDVACRVLVVTWVMTDPDADQCESLITDVQKAKWEELADWKDNDVMTVKLITAEASGTFPTFNRWMLRRFYFERNPASAAQWLEKARQALAIVEHELPTMRRKPFLLTTRCGISSPIVFENPADAIPSWPFHPFDRQSEDVDFAMWSGPEDVRQRCFPRREHLASFRRWDLDATGHFINWKQWRVILTAKCGQRLADLTGMNILDICDVLDTTEMEDEHNRIASGLRLVVNTLRRVELLEQRHRLPNDVAYLVCIGADLLAKGHRLPPPLTVAGEVGLANTKNGGTRLDRKGITDFAGNLAEFLKVKRPRGIQDVADVFAAVADYLVPVESLPKPAVPRIERAQEPKPIDQIVRSIRDRQAWWNKTKTDANGAATVIGSLLLEAIRHGRNDDELSLIHEIMMAAEYKLVGQNRDLSGELHALIRAAYLLMNKSGSFPFNANADDYLGAGVDAIVAWIEKGHSTCGGRGKRNSKRPATGKPGRRKKYTWEETIHIIEKYIAWTQVTPGVKQSKFDLKDGLGINGIRRALNRVREIRADFKKLGLSADEFESKRRLPSGAIAQAEKLGRQMRSL